MADIRKILASMEPKMRKAFEGAVKDLKSSAQIAVVTRAIEEGRIEDALRALHLTPEFFAPLDDAITAAYLEGGRDALIGIPALADPFPQAVLWSALTREIRAQRHGLQSGHQG